MSISIDGSGTITGATTMASTIASPTLTTPALGIPSSGTVTNLTGTASININGTVGATTPAAGAFTTLSTTGNATFDTDTMFIDAANNRVGIGTTSPGNKLTVYGSSIAALFESEGSSTGLQLKNNGSTASNWLVQTDSLAGTAALVFYSITAGAYRMVINGSGNVGIGTTTPGYKLEVSTDSAGKPGAGGLWTVVSDERIKTNIVPADLDRCYEIVKSVPLKHFGFAPGVYSDDQIQDKHNLGWIAQDVQKVFKHAVSVKPFTLKTAIPDGTEDYEEQDFTLETVEETKVSIEILHGKPVQVSKVVKTENKVLLFDTVEVLDEAGAVVMDGDNPLTHQMPRMVTKTRPKVRHEVIEDCLDLNSGQMIAALYGAVQALMAKVDRLEAALAAR